MCILKLITTLCHILYKEEAPRECTVHHQMSRMKHSRNNLPSNPSVETYLQADTDQTDTSKTSLISLFFNKSPQASEKQIKSRVALQRGNQSLCCNQNTKVIHNTASTLFYWIYQQLSTLSTSTMAVISKPALCFVVLENRSYQVSKITHP